MYLPQQRKKQKYTNDNDIRNLKNFTQKMNTMGYQKILAPYRDTAIPAIPGISGIAKRY